MPVHQDPKYIDEKPPLCLLLPITKKLLPLVNKSNVDMLLHYGIYTSSFTGYCDTIAEYERRCHFDHKVYSYLNI